MERLARAITTSTEASPSGISSALAPAVRTLGQVAREDLEHRGVGVGGVHVMAERHECAGELAGAGTQLEHGQRLVAEQPRGGLAGVRRAAAVVGVGDAPKEWAQSGVLSAGAAASPGCVVTADSTRTPVRHDVHRYERGSAGRMATLEGVPSAFAAARDGIDTMLRDRGLRRTSPETTAESLLRGAHASAVLEGSSSTLDEVRAGSGDAMAQDALRVSAELLGAGPAVLPLAAPGAGPAARPRGGRLGARRRARPAARCRIGRSAARASPSWWRADSAPALLVAAVVHAELATAAPFASPNGMVARAAERLVLASSGVDAKSLVVPEAGHLALRAAYESNLPAYADRGRVWPRTGPTPLPQAAAPHEHGVVPLASYGQFRRAPGQTQIAGDSCRCVRPSSSF